MVYLTIELQDRPDCNEIQDALEEITGARSVPRVFVDGKNHSLSNIAAVL